MASIRVALKLLMPSIQLTPWIQRFPQSWAAIIGGAFAAAALSLILLLSGLASAWLQCHHSHILELR